MKVEGPVPVERRAPEFGLAAHRVPINRDDPHPRSELVDVGAKLRGAATGVGRFERGVIAGVGGVVGLMRRLIGGHAGEGPRILGVRRPTADGSLRLPVRLIDQPRALLVSLLHPADETMPCAGRRKPLRPGRRSAIQFEGGVGDLGDG